MPDGAGEEVQIHYCGAVCQKEHWSKHKIDCKAAQTRRTLYRAANLAKAVFYLLRKLRWKMAIRDVEKVGNMWIVHRRDMHPKESSIVPFPSAMFPEKEDEEAILSWLGCADAADHMHNFFRLLLEGWLNLVCFNPIAKY